MSNHVIRRGLDIPIAGAASGDPEPLPMPASVSIDPREFRGIVPRLAARPGDRVAQGEPLFYDKSRPDMKYLAPLAGTVREVKRGHRRVITDIIVEVDAHSTDAASFPTVAASDIGSLDRDDVKARLQAGGLWWSLRQRPLSRVADPAQVPQSILVCATESGPLQPGPDTLLAHDAKDHVQAGIDALSRLTDGKVFLATMAGASHPALAGLTGVEVHTFKGPHPAGDPSVQVNHIDPPRAESVVWFIHAWEVARIGRLLLEGRYPADKVYAAVGVGVDKPRNVRTVVGAPLADIAGAVKDGPMRWIRGSVLTGDAASAESYGGWYTSAVHLLPDEVPRRLLGWMAPSFGQYSVHRAFLAGWVGARAKDLRPGLYGGYRGLVPVGQYRRVVATPDIQPEFLMKALSAGDLEESINLGLLDLSEEEAALCTYVCPSKIEYDVLLRKGLEMYEKET
jgi:Na+-transporting NADH:ubiquinone oxidoreductase subunit A